MGGTSVTPRAGTTTDTTTTKEGEAGSYVERVKEETMFRNGPEEKEGHTIETKKTTVERQ